MSVVVVTIHCMSPAHAVRLLDVYGFLARGTRRLDDELMMHWVSCDCDFVLERVWRLDSGAQSITVT